MINLFTNTKINSDLYTIKNYKKDDIIFNVDDKCDFVGFVEKGSISIVTPTFNENEYEINNISENGFFGAFIIFSDNPTFLGTAICKKATTVYQFSKNNLLVALEDKNFLFNYLHLTSESTIKIQTKVKILSQGSIKEKILFLLLNNYHLTKSNVFTFTSKINLANYLNVPRPSLSRVLIELKNDNIIDFDRHKIILKKGSLN